MKIKYIKESNLPVLAWCAKITKDDITVFHGDHVETFENFFVEGVWDGEFLKGDFHRAEFLNGTGGKIINKNEIIFSTPNHTIGRLNLIEKKNVIYISNSIPVILYKSNTRLKTNYRNYESDFDTILLGLEDYNKTIPLEDNLKIYLYYYTNLIINKNLGIKEDKKKIIKSFKNYEDYNERINRIVRKISINGKDTNRKQIYEIITTISNGYDAPACAVIAHKVGCKTAISFNNPEKYLIDFGGEVAKQIGYKNVLGIDAESYQKREDLVESMIVSSGEMGTGLVFTSFENIMKNNIVIFGIKGDVIWSKNHSKPNKEFNVENELNSHFSLIEYKLEIGFVELILPMYGFTQWESIVQISLSNEMQKYSISNDYDRPIARRIVEEYGVNRELFGNKKMGAGFSFRYDNLRRLENRMSKKSYKSFVNYYNKNKDMFLIRVMRQFKYYYTNKNVFLDYILKKIGININLDSRRKFVSNPGATSYLFQWGVEESIKRYENRK